MPQTEDLEINPPNYSFLSTLLCTWLPQPLIYSKCSHVHQWLYFLILWQQATPINRFSWLIPSYKQAQKRALCISVPVLFSLPQ